MLCWLHYFCFWTQANSFAKLSLCLQLSVSGDLQFELPASFSVLLSDVTVAQGEHALFTCRVCGRPRPQVSWRSPDGSILTAGTGVHCFSGDKLADISFCRDLLIAHAE